MQVPANTSGSSSLFSSSDTEQPSTTNNSTTIFTTKNVESVKISEPLHYLITTSPSSQQSAAPLSITTSSDNVWSSWANSLRNLLNPQPTRILTAPDQDATLPAEGHTTVVTPGANTPAGPGVGENNNQVPPSDQNQGGDSGTGSPPPSNHGSGNIGTTPPDNGTGSSGEMPSLIPSHAREFDRTGEIEWRPRLHDGKLSIIFRPEHKELADKVEIFSADGKTLLATGTRGSQTEDGRPTYTFDRAGGEFPNGAIVVMTFKNGGGVRRMTIPDSSERYVHGQQGNGGNVGGGTSLNTPAKSLVPEGAKELERTGEIEWRPRLSDGKLAIICRKNHTGLVDKIQVLSPDGTKVLAEGKLTGTSENGRPIYSFDKSGADFPDGALVMVTLKTGGTRTMKISETSEKYIHGTPSSGSTGTQGGGQTTGGGNAVGNNTGSQPAQSLIPSHAKEFEKTGQIEWRPRLNDGNLSVIFRRTHAAVADKVQIFSADGKTLLATGKRITDLPDGRPVYVFDKAGSAYPDGAVVVMTLKSGGVRKFAVHDSAEKFTY
jgi:hypothetical protein